MDFYKTVLEVIDLRSFSNLWYWIALAVMWSSASHWVLGVPHDMVTRARRKGGQAAEDLDALIRINTARMLDIARTAGLVLVAVTAFLLTLLLVLSVAYSVEFAQAVLLLLAPMTLVFFLSLRTAARIEAAGESGPALWRRLTVHRFVVQVIGMIAIFITAMFGMWQNMHTGVFG